jgi:uncharacterized protein YjbJ (UPF0337 family)
MLDSVHRKMKRPAAHNQLNLGNEVADLKQRMKLTIDSHHGSRFHVQPSHHRIYSVAGMDLDPPCGYCEICDGIPQRRNSMKQSSKDQAKGKLHEVKGKIKVKLGRATKNPNLRTEGEDEQVVGTVQKKIGQIEKVFEE